VIHDSEVKNMKYRVLSVYSRGVQESGQAVDAVRRALAAGSGVYGGQSTIKGLEWLEAEFDILVLAPEAVNGSFNSYSDDIGESGQTARAAYEQTGLRWLERPTIFWNPTFSQKIYSDVTGTVNVGLTEFRRCRNVGEVRPGQRAIVYVRRAAGRLLTKVVITAHEITLAPWVVLFHELGHTKQYFEKSRLSRMPFHSRQLESLWQTFAWAPNSSEPDNIARHEKPITKTMYGGYRERYYHDAFHFGRDSMDNAGWNGDQLNYRIHRHLTPLDVYDNFISTTGANQQVLSDMAAGLPLLPVGGAVDTGYYRTA
jgi:hypothetical protein